jgi:cysteine sulfinate desulfinase/cysteine desulfurase-like protein
MIDRTTIDKKTNIIMHRVEKLSRGEGQLGTLEAVIRKILIEVDEAAQERGYQEGIANLEDIMKQTRAEMHKELADAAGR